MRNVGPLALFTVPGLFERVRGRRYVYTDPDVVPVPDCPPDAFDLFAELLERHRGVAKVGFGLRIDDLPDTYAHKDAVVAWEQQFWQTECEPGVYRAPIDTTLALHRPSDCAFSFEASGQVFHTSLDMTRGTAT